MACAKKQSLIWYAYTYCHLLLLIRCPTYLGNRSSRIDRTFSTSFVRALATEGTKYKGFVRIEYYSAGRYVAWVDMLSYLPMVPMCCSFGWATTRPWRWFSGSARAVNTGLSGDLSWLIVVCVVSVFCVRFTNYHICVVSVFCVRFTNYLNALHCKVARSMLEIIYVLK